MTASDVHPVSAALVEQLGQAILTLLDNLERLRANGQAVLSAETTPYGFTGHRHDDEFGLIDMKGRIYDPERGRFLGSRRNCRLRCIRPHIFGHHSSMV